MPPAIAAALIGAGVAGTQMGLTASGALTPDQPNPNPSAALTSQNTALQKQLQSQTTQALGQASPFAAENTSGFLADPAFNALTHDLIGQPGNIGEVQASLGSSSMYSPGLAAGQTVAG